MSWTKDYFYARTQVNNITGCWEWQLCLDKRTGYGKCQAKDRVPKLVHRVSFETFIGPIPKGSYVLHKCDNRKCCNPEHLYLGSQLDNVHDMIKKKRQARLSGLERGCAKLEISDVRGIKFWLKLGYSQRRIAGAYNMSQTAIQNINAGTKWRFV